jgi:hypothetical protein
MCVYCLIDSSAKVIVFLTVATDGSIAVRTRGKPLAEAPQSRQSPPPSNRRRSVHMSNYSVVKKRKSNYYMYVKSSRRLFWAFHMYVKSPKQKNGKFTDM